MMTHDEDQLVSPWLAVPAAAFRTVPHSGAAGVRPLGSRHHAVGRPAAGLVRVQTSRPPGAPFWGPIRRSVSGGYVERATRVIG
jgi:hypothetical protein